MPGFFAGKSGELWGFISRTELHLRVQLRDFATGRVYTYVGLAVAFGIDTWRPGGSGCVSGGLCGRGMLVLVTGAVGCGGFGGKFHRFGDEWENLCGEI